MKVAAAGLVLALLAMSAAAEPCKMYTTSESQPMSDQVGLWSIISVEDEFAVQDVIVEVSAEARRMGTMKMALVASTSDGSSFKRVSLFSKKGGVSKRLAGTTFADSAAIPFPSGDIEAPFNAAYQPVMRLNRLAAGDSTTASEGGSMGSWILEFSDVVDNAQNRAAATALQSFTLYLCPAGAELPALNIAMPSVVNLEDAPTAEEAAGEGTVEAFTGGSGGGLLGGGLLGGLGGDKSDKVAGLLSSTLDKTNGLIDGAQAISAGIKDKIQDQNTAIKTKVNAGIAGLIDLLEAGSDKIKSKQKAKLGFIFGDTDSKVATISSILEGIKTSKQGVLDVAYDSQIAGVAKVGELKKEVQAKYDAKWDSVLNKFGVETDGLDEAGQAKLKLLKTLLTATMLKAVLPPPWGALTPIKTAVAGALGLGAIGIGFTPLAGIPPPLPPPIVPVPGITVHHFTIVFPDKPYSELEEASARDAFKAAFCTALEIHAGVYLNPMIPEAYDRVIPNGCEVHYITEFVGISPHGIKVTASLSHVGDPTFGLPFYAFVESPAFACAVFSGFDILTTLAESNPGMYTTDPFSIDWEGFFGDPSNCQHIEVMHHFVFQGMGVPPEIAGTWTKPNQVVKENGHPTTCTITKELSPFNAYTAQFYTSCSGPEQAHFSDTDILEIPLQAWCGGLRQGGYLSYVQRSEYYDTVDWDSSTFYTPDAHTVPKPGWVTCNAFRVVDGELEHAFVSQAPTDSNLDETLVGCQRNVTTFDWDTFHGSSVSASFVPGVLPPFVPPMPAMPPGLPFPPFNAYCTVFPPAGGMPFPTPGGSGGGFGGYVPGAWPFPTPGGSGGGYGG